MGEMVNNLQNSNSIHRPQAVVVHPLYDLTHVPPIVFVYLLKQCYFRGTLKAKAKFEALTLLISESVSNNPQPGPAIFVARCLYILPLFQSICNRFSDPIITTFSKHGPSAEEDINEARLVAAKLFVDVVNGLLVHGKNIVRKFLAVFEVGFADIVEVMEDSEEGNNSAEMATEVISRYVDGLIKSHSYSNAVSLIKRFSLDRYGEPLLYAMLERRRYKPANKFAKFMGKPMSRLLVQAYMDRKLVEQAYEVIKTNNLQKEYLEICRWYNERLLKELVEKGCFDEAEKKTNRDKRFLQYLVFMALESGYIEKVEELCNRYSIKGFTNIKLPETNPIKSNFLRPRDLSVEEIVFVDEANGLHNATCNIEDSKIIGFDCEWKADYITHERGKVSIMQIAAGNKVYILDMIKLYNTIPGSLDDCMTRIFNSPRILKLGYNLQCDVQHLIHSYEDLKCFRHYKMLLDFQSIFNKLRGGLSGLAKMILGASLNKAKREYNWENRPLSKSRLEYAALDAVVLIHIFRHVPYHARPGGFNDGNANNEWKSHIVTRLDFPHQKLNKLARRHRSWEAFTTPNPDYGNTQLAF